MLREQREILSLVRLPVPPLQPPIDFSNFVDAEASGNCFLPVLLGDYKILIIFITTRSWNCDYG